MVDSSVIEYSSDVAGELRAATRRAPLAGSGARVLLPMSTLTGVAPLP